MEALATCGGKKENICYTSKSACKFVGGPISAGKKALPTYSAKEAPLRRCEPEECCARSTSSGDTCKISDCCAGGKASVPKDNCCVAVPPARYVGPKKSCCHDKEADLGSNGCCSEGLGLCTGGKTSLPTDDCCVTEKAAACDRDSKNMCFDDKEVSRTGNSNYNDHERAGNHHSDERTRSSYGACEAHLEQAFQRYSKYLELGLCICRSALDRLDGCCGKLRTNPLEGTLSVESRGSSSSVITHPAPALGRITKRSGKRYCGMDHAAQNSKILPRESPCSLDDIKITSEAPRKPLPSKTRLTDVEGDAAREHIVLSVSGMTCTGCARKVINVLENVDAVSAAKVTFVTGIAEFDFDQKSANLRDIIDRIQKETGFKFSQLVSTLQILDLLVDSSAAHGALEALYDLCESVERISKNTYRVSYDPASVGARTILSSAPGVCLALPGGDGQSTDGRRRLIRMGLATAWAALTTIPILVLAWSNLSLPDSTRSILELVLGTFVQAIAVPEFYAGALKSLIYSKVLEMDMLVVVSITAAYGYSVVAFALNHAGYSMQEGAFFETSSLLITLVLLGRLIAAVAKVRAVSAVSVRSLQAEKAILLDSSLGNTTEIDARLLQLGDVFIVPAHGTVPTDGEVIQGASAVDESMLTGESIPVPKTVGDQLIAGTTNGPGRLTVRLTRLPGKNSITDIAGLVENALASKPHIQDLADKIASYFIPAVITVSSIVFGIWVTVALKLRGENGGGAVGLSITYGIAVLAVSCPCALGLAVPMVLIIAGGVAARQGVIIKQADAIERGYKVTDVIFDKTGTITSRELEVVHSRRLHNAEHAEDEINSVIRTLVQDNHHPVSLAVAADLEKTRRKPCTVESLESVPGSGLQGLWDGHIVRAGSPFWLGIEDQPEIQALLDQGMTVLCVTVDAALVAVFGLKCSIRREAAEVIADLHNRGLTCHIVSGDAPKAVEDVAEAVAIPISNIASRHSPAQKQEYVQALMASKKVVLFCGDGTNDAVAVAQADVGVQIGVVSAVTRQTADVVLLGGLEPLPALLTLSKRSFHRITFNFVWSAVYNLFAILLAGGAFVKVRIPPAYAGLGEIVSVLPVILAALTLTRAKFTKPTPPGAS